LTVDIFDSLQVRLSMQVQRYTQVVWMRFTLRCIRCCLDLAVALRALRKHQVSCS